MDKTAKAVKQTNILPVILGCRGRSGNEDFNNLMPFIKGGLGSDTSIKRYIHIPGITEEHTFVKSFPGYASLIAEKAKEPLCIFVISDFRTARIKDVQDFIKSLKTKYSDKEDVFVYHIILDMLRDFDHMEHRFFENTMGSGSEAIGLGALPCLCNYDPFTSGYKRVAELIRRIMGLDLPEPHFPNYNWKMLLRIACHLNCENLNSGRERMGAIPKYSFDENGKPTITDKALKQYWENFKRWENDSPKVTETTVYKCPHCGVEVGPSSEIWDKAKRKIRCSACRNICSASGTGLEKLIR